MTETLTIEERKKLRKNKSKWAEFVYAVWKEQLQTEKKDRLAAIRAKKAARIAEIKRRAKERAEAAKKKNMEAIKAEFDKNEQQL